VVEGDVNDVDWNKRIDPRRAHWRLQSGEQSVVTLCAKSIRAALDRKHLQARQRFVGVIVKRYSGRRHQNVEYSWGIGTFVYSRDVRSSGVNSDNDDSPQLAVGLKSEQAEVPRNRGEPAKN